jgi:hypothetical protein
MVAAFFQGKSGGAQRVREGVRRADIFTVFALRGELGHQDLAREGKREGRRKGKREKRGQGKAVDRASNQTRRTRYRWEGSW